MASIQQSLNQLLGATAGVATAGAYMYRQTPGYQAKQLERGVEKINKQFNLQGEKTLQEATPEERARMLRAGEEATKLREEALKIAPTPKRLENIEKAETSLKTLKEGIAQAEAHEAEQEARAAYEAEQAEAYEASQNITPVETAKARAEQNAITRLQNTIEAQTEQKNSLKDRFDRLREILSAKERGQLDTMYNRHRKKGEID